MKVPANGTSSAIGERRRTRIAHQTIAELYTSDWSVIEGILQDISQTGLYLQVTGTVSTRPTKGAGVTIKLIMEKKQSLLVVEAWAKVVRVDQQGVAIRFREPLPWWPVFALFPSENRASLCSAGSPSAGGLELGITIY